MTQIHRIDAGPRMSEVVVYNGIVYTAGVIAGDDTVGKSIYEQTVDVLSQIDAMLAEAGSDKTRILKANIWLADMGTFADMNKAWDAWVVPGQGPARATVEAKLAGEGYGVEIMIEAAVK